MADKLEEPRKDTEDPSERTRKLLQGLTSSGYTGSVTPNNSPTGEAYLQCAKALLETARTIASDVMQVGPARVVVTSSSDMPGFWNLTSFRLNQIVLSNAFDSARSQTAESLRDEQVRAMPMLALAEIGWGLEALNKVASYFKVDYAVGGYELALDDSLLLTALLGELGERAVATPLLALNAAPDGKAWKALTDQVQRIAGLRAEAQRLAALFEKKATEAAASASTDPAAVSRYQAAAAAWNRVLSIHDTLFGKLFVPDEKGGTPLVTLIREAAVAEELKNEARFLLAVRVFKAAGSYITRKSLLTAIGLRVPYWVSGSVIACYVLFDCTRNEIAKARVIPMHSGYTRIEIDTGSSVW